MYQGQKIQANGSPRKQAQSGCEAPREPARNSHTATVVAAYGNMIRVKWDDEVSAEDGWRRAEDFVLIYS